MASYLCFAYLKIRNRSETFTSGKRLIDGKMFNAIFNIISFLLPWPVHVSIFFYQFSMQYSFQATGCFPKQPTSNLSERSKSCHNDYHLAQEKRLTFPRWGLNM